MARVAHRIRAPAARLGGRGRGGGAGAPAAAAELRLIDEVAPVGAGKLVPAPFRLRGEPVCDPAADEFLAAARIASSHASRRALLASADRIITDAAPFIPLAAPVRWSLVSPRLTGFRPNRFGRHPAGELVRRAP
jgi:peptide/nickel transport system substrate-binding protein